MSKPNLCLIVCVVVTLTMIAPAIAESDDDLRAKAAMALACARQSRPKAKADQVAKIDLNKPLTLDQAKSIAREGRVVLVRVGGLDCSSLCSKLRPEIPTAHVAEMWDNPAPRLQLILGDKTGAIWTAPKAWRSLPTESEIRAAATELRQLVTGKSCTCAVCPTADCRCGCQAVFPSQTIAPAWSNCPDGRCGVRR